MAGPITWRNVNNGDGNAAQLLGNAGRSIAYSTDGLLNVLKDMQTQTMANDKILTNNNTQNYLDKVAATPLDQLQDPTVQAGLASMRQALVNTHSIDQAGTRDAITAQQSKLQASALEHFKYLDGAQLNAEKPIVGEAYSRMANGDIQAGLDAAKDTRLTADSQRQLIAAANGLTDRNTNNAYKAEDQQFQRNGEARAVQSQKWAAESQAFASAMRPIQMASAKVGLESSQVNLAENKANFSFTQAERAKKSATNLLDAQEKALDAAQAGKIGNNQFLKDRSTDPAGDAFKIFGKDAAKGNFDSYSLLTTDNESRTKLFDTATKLLKDGVVVKVDGKDAKVPISPSLLEQALASTAGSTWVQNGGAAKGLEAWTQDYIKNNPDAAKKAALIDADTPNVIALKKQFAAARAQIAAGDVSNLGTLMSKFDPATQAKQEQMTKDNDAFNESLMNKPWPKAGETTTDPKENFGVLDARDASLGIAPKGYAPLPTDLVKKAATHEIQPNPGDDEKTVQAVRALAAQLNTAAAGRPGIQLSPQLQKLLESHNTWVKKNQ